MWLIKHVSKLGGLSRYPYQNYIRYNWDYKNIVQDYSKKYSMKGDWKRGS